MSNTPYFDAYEAGARSQKQSWKSPTYDYFYERLVRITEHWHNRRAAIRNQDREARDIFQLYWSTLNLTEDE